MKPESGNQKEKILAKESPLGKNVGLFMMQNKVLTSDLHIPDGKSGFKQLSILRLQFSLRPVEFSFGVLPTR